MLLSEGWSSFRSEVGVGLHLEKKGLYYLGLV